jgi:hypothetical protein
MTLVKEDLDSRGVVSRELTAQSLQSGRFDIPVGWAAQKRVLGFAPPA